MTEASDLRPQASGKRLFVGVRVSVATANAIAACAELLARRARDAGVELKWVPPVNYHVTLKFLGWTRDDAVGAVRDALERACEGGGPLELRAARLGAFASLEKATVLWAGIGDAPAFGELAKRIDAAMVGLGYTREERAFHAHVTMARLREPKAIRELVLPMAEQVFSTTRVSWVSLFESETKSSGSVYRELARIGFSQASEGEKRQTAALEAGDDTDDGWPRGGRGP
jgi:RNA 2',3'-cyclic 3'-phosphodiesterase